MKEQHIHDLLGQAIYSEEMKALSGKPSSIAGFVDVREAAEICKAMSEYAAVNNGLQADYCGLLALLFFAAAENFDFLKEETKLLADAAAIMSGEIKEASAEAKCTALVLKTVTELRALGPQELEKRGGWSVAVCTAVDEIKIN